MPRVSPPCCWAAQKRLRTSLQRLLSTLPHCSLSTALQPWRKYEVWSITNQRKSHFKGKAFRKINKNKNWGAQLERRLWRAGRVLVNAECFYLSIRSGRDGAARRSVLSWGGTARALQTWNKAWQNFGKSRFLSDFANYFCHCGCWAFGDKIIEAGGRETAVI